MLWIKNQAFQQRIKELKEKTEELKGVKEDLKVRTKQTTEQLYKHVDGAWTEAEATSKKVSENLKEKVFAATIEVLELGIIVHSVIIGLSLGASKSPETIKPLIVALSFHQFFEGVGLGGCIFQAKIKSLAITIMGAFFTLTTPSGIVIGILVSSSYKENSTTALIVEGVLNAASSGILIYMALVDLLSPDFKNPRMQKSKIILLGSNVSLLLGAGLMSLLAKWA
ncbi:hypothetical protein L2E82_14896 [Cichorium intybus]|uniref:Uncharacterized protein n=1 Tax=Cichorium intybus TaxID=13427 RepID=A0ACB9F0Y2_CICIN|nr:hypothetical protein L2E82_14896 [Cichorium intybus]